MVVGGDTRFCCKPRADIPSSTGSLRLTAGSEEGRPAVPGAVGKADSSIGRHGQASKGATKAPFRRVFQNRGLGRRCGMSLHVFEGPARPPTP